jgi:hypothetical protein
MTSDGTKKTAVAVAGGGGNCSGFNGPMSCGTREPCATGCSASWKDPKIASIPNPAHVVRNSLTRRFSHSYIKTFTLPRQARDKQERKLRKTGVLCRSTSRPLSSRASGTFNSRTTVEGSVRATNAFCEPFYAKKRSLYRDRLGTNIEKVEQEGVLCRGHMLDLRPTFLILVLQPAIFGRLRRMLHVENPRRH